MPLHRPNWPKFVKQVIPKGNVSERIGVGRPSGEQTAPSMPADPELPRRSNDSAQVAPRRSLSKDDAAIPALRLRAPTNLAQDSGSGPSFGPPLVSAGGADALQLPSMPRRSHGSLSAISSDHVTTDSMTSSQARSLLSLQQRTGLMAEAVQANPIFAVSASTEKFSVFRDEEPLRLHSRGSNRTYDFEVTYQVGTPSALTSQAQTGLSNRFPNRSDLFDHLKRLLAADFSKFEAASNYPADYEKRLQEVFRNMEARDPRRRALENWTEPGNEYTDSLNGSLIHYSTTGERQAFESEDSLRSEPMIDPLEEERNLRQGILALPELDRVYVTLRVSSADAEHYSTSDGEGRFFIAGKIEPGDFVTNYPLPMSTTSGVDLGQFSTLDSRDREIRILDVSGVGGRPLLSINPVDDEEKEVLYHSHSAFQLVAAARAVPSDPRVCPRVVAIYQEVAGKDPSALKNIHTGIPASHLLL